MRQKTNYAVLPDALKIERAGHNAVIRFRENITEHENGETTWFEADEYTLESPFNVTLENRVYANYESWLFRAKQADYEKTSESARNRRDKSLLKTDWTQVKDVSLSEFDIAAYAEYRQALRDIPQQSGFPYTIVWPKMP